MRRSSYKGSSKCSRNFPLDCTSLAGLAGCLCVILGGRGLGRELLQTAKHILTGLSSVAKVNGTFKLLPNEEECWLDVVDSMVARDDVKRLLNFLSIGYSRHGCEIFSTIEVLDY